MEARVILPFQYLRHVLYPIKLKPQKLEIRKDGLKTLNDFQKEIVIGDVQWLQSYSKLSTGDLEPLNDILKGDGDPNSLRQLTEKGRQILSQIENAIQYQQIHYIDYDQPWQAYILPTRVIPTPVLWQNGPLLWLQLPALSGKVLYPYFEAVACFVQKSLVESRRSFGKEPEIIGVPFALQQIGWLFQNIFHICAFSHPYGDVCMSNHMYSLFLSVFHTHM